MPKLKAAPDPRPGARYPQFWRSPGISPGLPVAASVLMAVAFVALSFVVVLVTVIITMPSVGELSDLALGVLSPEMVLANSIAIALVLPCGFLVVRLVRQRPGFLSSVAGRFRWGFFLRCVGVAAAVFAVYFGVSIAVDGVDSLGLSVHEYSWWLLAGLMLVTPFQAASEEYLLRGFLFRTVGSWFGSPLVAAVIGGVVNSVVFSAMHMSPDPWLNVVYFSMGAIASYLTWRTGGLEAAVSIHIVNNMIGMGFLPFQDMAAQFDRSVGAGDPSVLLQVGAFAAAALLIVLVARRSQVAVAAPEAAPDVTPSP